MREGAVSAGTVPVLLVRFGDHRVPNRDPLRVATPSLHPAFTLDDNYQLAPNVGMPVITNARLETNN
jgi:hypothetical protein